MPETNDNSLSDVIEKLNSKIDTLGKEVKESSSKKGLIGDLNTGLESLAENIVNSVKAPFEGISKGLGSLKDSVSAPFKSMKKFISAPLKGLEIGKRLFGKKKSADGDMIKPLQAIKLGIDKLVQSSVGSIPFIASTSNLIERNTADLAVSTDQNTTILDSTGNEIKLEAEKSKEIVSTVTQTEKTTTALVDAVKNSSVVFVNAISESHKGSSETLNTTDKTVSTSNVTSSVSAIDSKETEKFSLTDLVKDFASTVSSFVGGNTDKPIDKTLVATSKETSSTGSTTSNTKSDVNSNTLLSVIADKSSAIFSAVSDKSSSLFDKISSNSASTISSASDTSSTLAAKSSSILQAIADKSASIFNTVADKSSSLLSTISDKITTTVVGGKGKDSQKLGTKEKVITAGVQSSGISSIEKPDSMPSMANTPLSVIADKSSSLLSTISDKSSSLLSTVSDKSSSLLSTVSDKSSSIFNTVADKSSLLSDKSSSLLSTISDKSSSIFNTVADKSSLLSDKSSSLLSTVSDKSSSLLSTVSDKSLSIFNTVADKSSLLSDKSSSLLSTVSDKSSSLLSTVSDKSSLLSDKSSSLLSTISDKSSSVLSTVSNKSSSLLSTVSDKSSSLLSTVSDKSSSDTSSTLAAKSSSILQAIADKSASIFNTVADKSSSLLSTISDKITTTVVGGKGKGNQKISTEKKVIATGVQSSGISNIEKTDSMSNAIVSSITTSSNALSESISKLHDGNSSSLHSIDKSLVENNSNVTTDRLQEREVQKDRIARSEKLVTAIGNIEIDASEKIEKKGFLSGLFSDIKFVLTASIVGFGKSIALKVGSMFVKTAGLLKGKLAGTKIGTGMKSMKEKVGATKIGTSFKERRAARNQGITSTKNVKSLNVDKVRESPTRKRRGKAGRGVASKAGGGIASIGKGAGKGITGFLKGIGRGLKAISNPKYLIGAGVLIALGGALFITGKALKLFTGIDWKGVLLGVGVLTALGVGAALLGSIGPMILIGAAAIAALGAALIPAGIAFNSFSGVDWKGVGIGISVLTALGAAAFGLSLISPAIFVGALAIAALGAALIPAAAAFNLFSNGLAAFESFLPVLGEFVDGALGGLIDLSAAGPGLLSAAVGIGAVSAALIAFGASSALGGLLSFFGGDPIEKFLKLADRATDLGVAGQALKTITDSINQFDSEPIDLMSISIHKLADALGMLQDGMMKKDPLKPLKRLAQIDIEEVANNFKKIGDGASKLIKLAGGSTSDVEDNITNIAASSGVMGGTTLNSAKGGGNVSGLEKNINSSSLVKSGVLEAEASQSGAFMQNKYNETTAIKGINEEARGSGGGDANVVVQGSTTSQVTNTTINNDAHVDRTMMLIPSF